MNLVGRQTNQAGTSCWTIRHLPAYSSFFLLLWRWDARLTPLWRDDGRLLYVSVNRLHTSISRAVADVVDGQCQYYLFETKGQLVKIESIYSDADSWAELWRNSRCWQWRFAYSDYPACAPSFWEQQALALRISNFLLLKVNFNDEFSNIERISPLVIRVSAANAVASSHRVVKNWSFVPERRQGVHYLYLSNIWVRIKLFSTKAYKSCRLSSIFYFLWYWRYSVQNR